MIDLTKKKKLYLDKSINNFTYDFLKNMHF